MQEVERRASNSHSEYYHCEADVTVDKSRETDHMMELIGKVFRQVKKKACLFNSEVLSYFYFNIYLF